MVTFTALVKILSTNTEVAGLGEIFIQQNFPHTRYTVHPVFKKITYLEFKY